MEIGILGFPGAGKKTIFQLLTGVAPSGHRGGVTPGVAHIRDSRVDALARIYAPQRVKYAEIQFLLLPDVEIGGTRAAAWLDAVRDADAVCLVVRGFDDPAVFHPHETIDPARDARALETELILADLALAETRLERIAKDRRHSREPRLQQEHDSLQRATQHLESEQPLRTMAWDDRTAAAIKSLGFLSRRPVLVVLNTDEVAPDPGAVASALGGPVTVLPLNVKLELEVAAIEDPAERATFLAELGIEEPAVAALSRAAHEAAGLISFFSVDSREVHAWTARRGIHAPRAAGKIHTDMERGFIRADVVPWQDLVEAGSEAAARAAGLWKLKGKDYEVQDGDVVHVRFSV